MSASGRRPHPPGQRRSCRFRSERVSCYTSRVLKAKVFISCSTERLPVAHALKQLLNPCAEATIWNDAGFPFGRSTLTGLIDATVQNDFAVFIFSPDDSVTIRTETVGAVRDNVVFELGLFMGEMGRDRAIWLSLPERDSLRTIADLEGITHLVFPESPSPDLLPAALQKPATEICDHIRRLGPRDEQLICRRALCLASSRYEEERFRADIEYIHSLFSGEEPVHKRGVTAEEFSTYFGHDNRWDIIHLGLYVDDQKGVMIFDPPPGRKSSGTLDVDGVAELIKRSESRLVTIITCDSLRFGSTLARFTNVIAGHRPIEPRPALDWAKHFYGALANEKSLLESFRIAQKIADPGLILLAHKDIRFRRGTSRVPEYTAGPRTAT